MGIIKKCNLTGCNKPVGRGLTKYCTKEHSDVARLNTMVISNAEIADSPINKCSNRKCFRLYQGFNEEKMCQSCRTNSDRICKRDGCGSIIPATRMASALYCTNDCMIIQKNINRTQPKNKKVGCFTKGCKNTFRKRSGSHKFCHECSENKGAVYKPGSGVSGPGKPHYDTRAKICTENGKTCSDYSQCTDPVMINGKSKFILPYDMTGKNCYSREDIARVRSGNSFGLCSDNRNSFARSRHT